MLMHKSKWIYANHDFSGNNIHLSIAFNDDMQGYGGYIHYALL